MTGSLALVMAVIIRLKKLSAGVPNCQQVFQTVSRCSKVSNLLHFDISLILNITKLFVFPPRIVLKLTVILRMAQPMPKHVVLLNKLLISCVLCVDFRNKTAASHTFLHSTAIDDTEPGAENRRDRILALCLHFVSFPSVPHCQGRFSPHCPNNHRTSRPCMCSCSVTIGTSGHLNTVTRSSVHLSVNSSFPNQQQIHSAFLYADQGLYFRAISLAVVTHTEGINTLREKPHSLKC
jgi:hypothetical protein